MGALISFLASLIQTLPNRTSAPTSAPIAQPPVNDDGISFENGINGLYIGHSFFQPIAATFNAMVTAENSATGGGAFPNHQFDSFFAGGMSGMPANLWNNENARTTIENKLSTGNVDLFGMNVPTPLGSALDDFSNWIDLALSYNDQTSFLIGQPWPPRTPATDTDSLRSTAETSSASSFSVIQDLRTKYPSQQIFFIDYGYTAPIMKAMFESNALPDIVTLTPGTTETALFTDGLGHAGPMLEDMCALVWMNILYGVDYAELQQQLDYETSSVTDILAQVMDFNEVHDYN